MFIIFLVYVFFMCAWQYSLLQLCCHLEVEGVFVGTYCSECMINEYALFFVCLLSMWIYACIFMIIVFMHKAMVCGWCCHS